MPRFDKLPDIYHYYVTESERIIKDFDDADVLKTDCHNESGIFEVAEPIVPVINKMCRSLKCIEIDGDTIKKAIDKIGSFNVVRGDVRNMPYSNHSFDVIIDLSTIDHVQFPKQVLAEYNRVLRAKGKVLMFVWTNDKFTWSKAEHQAFFEREQLREDITQYFHIDDEEDAFTDEPYAKRMLKRYILSKRDWAYLEDMDWRYAKAAKLLDDIQDMNVVELDCGNGRFVQYLRGHKSYRGNDLAQCNTKHYSDLDDKEFVKTVTACDVLAVFGVGGYEFSFEPSESSTLTESYNYLVRRFKPDKIVLEGVSRFKPIIIKMIPKGYKIRQTYSVDAPDWLHQRMMWILEKK